MTELTKREMKSLYEKQSIKDYFNSERNGTFVEVGAHEPTSNESQSWHLERELGWSGILVEPNPYLSEQARKLRPNAIVYQCACTSSAKTGDLVLYIPIKNGNAITSHASLQKNVDDFDYQNHKEVQVKAKTLDSLLEESGMSSIDFLSIDVEGTELDVLKGLNLKEFRPRLILLEDKFSLSGKAFIPQKKRLHACQKNQTE